MRNDAALLLDMLIAMRKIERFVSGMSEDQFSQNDMVQSAVIREFQVLGEAARMISDETKAKHTGIPWPVISGMRNRLVHEYFDIRLSVVWETIQRDIPNLREQVEAITKDEDDNGIK